MIEFPCYLEYQRKDGVSGITKVNSLSELERRVKEGDYFPIMEEWE